jgi:hypothetical protein
MATPTAVNTDSKSAWLARTLLVGTQTLDSKVALQDDLMYSATAQPGKLGGLFTITKGAKPQLRVVDYLETSGICLDGNLFVRSVQHTEHMILFFYTPDSVWSVATDAFKQVHDVRHQFGQLYVVSTSTNEVVQLDSQGRVQYRWQFPGEGDAWHLNCLDLWDGRYVISCFGKFQKEREFKGQWKGAGILFDLESEEILWHGLSLPHTPRIDKDGRQIILDSGTHRLLYRNPDGTNQREVVFPGAFTRGMAFGKNHIYVGLSVLRPSIESKVQISNAKIAVLEQTTFKQVGEIDLPTAEVYEILVTSD